MREKNQKKKASKLPIIIGVSLGIIISFFDIKYDILGSLKYLTFGDIFFLILILSISFFLVILIHELGHLIFGKIKGFGFSSFRIGPFSIDNNSGKLNFSIIRPEGYGGLSVMYPKKSSSLNDFLFYLFGGIVFNLVSGIIFLLISYFNDYGFKINAVFIMFGLMSLILGIQNLIPFYSGNNPSDGRMIFSIIKKDEFAKKFYRNFMISNQLIAGTRPKDIDSNMEIDFEIKESLDLSLLLLEYFRYLDKNNKEKIEKYINKIEENIEWVQSYHLPSYYYELIHYYSIRANKEKVDYYLNKLKKMNYSLAKDKDINGKRVNAYYNYFILGDKEAAFKLGKEGLVAFDSFPIKGQAKMEKNLIEKLLMLYN